MLRLGPPWRDEMTTSRVAALDAGDAARYLLFWGHQPQRDGSVGKGCLSQWWPAPFETEGERFATAEHYMMWRKARLFGDDRAAAAVLAAGHPKQAKEIGRGVVGFDEDVWQRECFGIVTAANTAKFGQHPQLHAFLRATSGRVLVEASPLDRVWGIGLAADHPDAENPRGWRGANLLGFALMEARTRLS